MITKKSKLITMYMFMFFALFLYILYFYNKLSFNPWLVTLISILNVIYNTIKYFRKED
jgi:hypothetical protein